jgi:hypothetical protein
VEIAFGRSILQPVIAAKALDLHGQRVLQSPATVAQFLQVGRNRSILLPQTLSGFLITFPAIRQEFMQVVQTLDLIAPVHDDVFFNGEANSKPFQIPFGSMP